jgi:hypothetical protein
MITRFLLVLLVCAAVARAEEDWEVRGNGGTQKDILEQDIEDFVNREKLEEQGWLYDRSEIWDTIVWDLSAGGWYTRLRGPIRLGGTQLIDVTDILGVEKSEGAPTARVQASYGSFEGIIDWYGVNYDGVQALETEIELPDGEIVPIGAFVVTDIDIRVLRTLGSIRLWHKERLVNVAVMLGINWYWLKGTLTAAVTDVGSTTARWDVILPIPVLGLAVWGRLGPLFYRVEFAGLGISLSYPDELLSTIGGGCFDGKATLGYYVTKRFSIRGGYRYTDVEAFADSVKVEFKMDGFFFELAITF